MGNFTLQSNSSSHTTTISNLFIDLYMPSANGSFVKVYLYLLRCLSDHTQTELSVEKLADLLENTENDVVRALHYWEKANLITIKKDNKENIIAISINELNESENPNIIPSSAPESESNTQSMDEVSATVTSLPDKVNYTEEQITALSSDEEVQYVLHIIELYRESMLKPTDVQLVLYLYDTLGFSTELIMYLYEYCISKGKKATSYIEAVALKWAENNIDTIEKAESFSTKYNTNTNAVIKAFGLNRSLTPVEKEFTDKWYQKYGFNEAVIVEACNRTVLSTQKTDFKYADKILENWHTHGVRTINDITELDKKYNKQKNYTQSKNVQQPKKPNQFQSFPQRDYSNDDYSSMEQKLLQK